MEMTEIVTDGGGVPALRVAILGAPRTGNTWLRHMLRDAFDLSERSAFLRGEVDWDNLPGRCVLQMHEYPRESFPELLETHGFRVLSTARHPLDVLMSWLNYLYYAHQENRCWRCWGPEGCKERDIIGVPPRSRAFLDYATGVHARSFLNFGPEWWGRPGVFKARYEETVADPEGTLGRISEWLGEPFRRPPAEVVEANAIGRRKAGEDFWQYHYWQGQPGLWRKMLPAEEARAIAANLPEALEGLGYVCDPDESLGPAQADLNWLQLQLDSMREHLSLEKAKHSEKTKALATLREAGDQIERLLLEERVSHDSTRQSLEQLGRSLDDERRSLATMRQSLAQAEIRLHAAHERLIRVDEIGPRLMDFALRANRIAKRVRGRGLRSRVHQDERRAADRSADTIDAA
jgi:hypothetical protein